MDEGVQKAVQEYRRDPAAVSKKTEGAILTPQYYYIIVLHSLYIELSN
jgi:hypothetical protein